MENPDISFEEAEFALRQSWEVHRQAFGPILEPAFTENKQVRIILINALNHISRREVKRGIDLLKEIKQYCVYDEDNAAWSFCVGLAAEMSGAKKQMVEWYENAAKYRHRFYLPYLKLAKEYHGQGQYEQAREHYEAAIDCLLDMTEDDREEVVLGSAYTNYASCLTMLYLYKQAEEAWSNAVKYPLQSGAEAIAAILYAAMGDSEKAEKYISDLKKTCPQWVTQIQMMTRQILEGVHPNFPKK